MLTLVPRMRSGTVALSVSVFVTPPTRKVSWRAVPLLLTSRTSVPDRETPGTPVKVTVPVARPATPVTPSSTNSASPPVSDTSARALSPSDAVTLVAANRTTVWSALSPAPPATPSAPSEVERSTAMSPLTD